VDIDTRVWNYSNTGTKLHAFLNGVAICRSSIRRPGAEHTALDYCEARSHQMCATCDKRFNAAIERIEASMEPSTGEGDYLPPAETPAPEATPVTEPEETAVPAPHRPKTGPLTPFQQEAMLSVIDGAQQREAAKFLGTSAQYISGELALATSKLRAKTLTEAACRMATARAYVKAAEDIDNARVWSPIDPAEEHANHVLEELAKILRDRAAKLIPS